MSTNARGGSACAVSDQISAVEGRAGGVCPFARKDGVDREWWDVLAMIAGEKEAWRRSRQRQAITEGHCVARPADLWRSAGAAGAGIRAVNEAGVVFAFAWWRACWVHGAQDTDGVSRLRSHAQGGTRQWQRVRMSLNLKAGTPEAWAQPERVRFDCVLDGQLAGASEESGGD